MALKIFAIVLVLFLAEIVFLSTKDFQDNSNDRKDFDFTDISFENIHGYHVTKDGVEEKLEAFKLLKYKDRAEAYKIKTEFTHQNKKSIILAQKATIKGDIIHLNGDVNYEDNSSLEIKSQNLVYNTKTKITMIDTPFILTSNQGDIKGSNLIYDQKNGTIKAKNIHYISADKE